MADTYIAKICRRCGMGYQQLSRRGRTVHVCCESCRFVLSPEELAEYAAAVAA